MRMAVFKVKDVESMAYEEIRVDYLRYFDYVRFRYFDRVRIMEAKEAVRSCGALATDSRVNILRLLATAKGGMASGDVARELGVPPNTLSTQLTLLLAANLVSQRRVGRNVIYSVNRDGIKDLIGFLVQDCAGGRIKGLSIRD